jgi:hypothetical protein
MVRGPYIHALSDEVTNLGIASLRLLHCREFDINSEARLRSPIFLD